jgi:hypothetical protein
MSAYIYLVVLKPTGQRYFGCRWANVLPPEEDLWQEYITDGSSPTSSRRMGCLRSGPEQ